MSSPRLLDLFCGAGGATKGYQRAGFYVVGVDIKPQPHYCGDEFVQADALQFLARPDVNDWPVRYDAVHASPPCQAYSTMSNRWGSSAKELIADTRSRLRATDLLYVIENVAGAKREFKDSIRLTGEMFGLRTHRARLFECSWLIAAPPQPPRQADPVAVYGKLDGRRLWTRTDGTEHRAPSVLKIAQDALGIDWMRWDELREAIPPAYTEYIGKELLNVLRGVGISGEAEEAP